MNKKVFIILIVAFLVRLISLNQSLWLDEATTAKVIQTYSYSNIILRFSPFDFHPPFYYFFMKFWTGLIGYSEIALRLPSVLFSLFTGYVIFKIGELIKNINVGFWSMLFFLFNPLIVYYSQEARMYMMTVFFLSLAFYFFLKRDFLLFNFFNILSFYSFYGSIFIIAGFFLLLFLKKTYRSLLFSAFLFAIALLCISPLLYSQFTHSRQALIYVNNWNLVLGKASIKNLLLIPLKFSSGRISFYPKILYYIVTGIWALIVWTFVSRGAIKNMGIRILLFLPLVLGFLFSFISPLLQYFRFLYLIVPMSLLLGIETVKKWQRFILLAGMTIFSLIYLIMPQFHREDWKTAAESLIDYHSVYMILDSSDPIRYYAPALFIKELRTLEGIDIEKEVVVIPYTADIYGFDYKKELMKHRFTYKETRHFRGVWYEIWSKNKIYAGSFLYSFTEA